MHAHTWMSSRRSAANPDRESGSDEGGDLIWHGNSSGLTDSWLLMEIKLLTTLNQASAGPADHGGDYTWKNSCMLTCVRQRGSYSVMVSRSAMPPSTMRWMMEPCSSSDRLRWDTRGVDSLVAGEGSTPWSHSWASISSRVARFLGSRCSMWAIRLEGVTQGSVLERNYRNICYVLQLRLDTR